MFYYTNEINQPCLICWTSMDKCEGTGSLESVSFGTYQCLSYAKWSVLDYNFFSLFYEIR